MVFLLDTYSPYISRDLYASMRVMRPSDAYLASDLSPPERTYFCWARASLGNAGNEGYLCCTASCFSGYGAKKLQLFDINSHVLLVNGLPVQRRNDTSNALCLYVSAIDLVNIEYFVHTSTYEQHYRYPSQIQHYASNVTSEVTEFTVIYPQ